eukprot:CAMPEP_0206568220 /NCGR_PEP_ID=MMETSP0325_2-20121206/25715_1 /ASSEMBLY_ACC=CAM_ASM_000347 /TAXON_ID=2866 /ORGANISM="Crypthecodinium cohnii, Strain Seligo" /LENGTH=123 /DNA_ID=CAMNT_0054071581 /DNA_START=231 /DNA_END=599 /DNA_ORIENTATION=-
MRVAVHGTSPGRSNTCEGRDEALEGEVIERQEEHRQHSLETGAANAMSKACVKKEARRQEHDWRLKGALFARRESGWKALKSFPRFRARALGTKSKGRDPLKARYWWSHGRPRAKTKCKTDSS